jgi:hypothetical protein
VKNSFGVTSRLAGKYDALTRHYLPARALAKWKCLNAQTMNGVDEIPARKG